MMTKDSLNIAIIGGGIAGLALGCTLKMNSIDCTIFERSHDVSDYGAGISISRNGLKIFEKLNLIDELRLNSFQPEETIWKYRNKEFLRMPVEIYSMSRQKLFRVFYDKYINLNGIKSIQDYYKMYDYYELPRPKLPWVNYCFKNHILI